MKNTIITNLPKIIGHRGACAHAPENTLASLQRAYELGATWVEFDVMLTADGEAIIIHDETVNRTTNGRGRVGELNYAELAKLDAGTWYDPQFAGERIPRLVDVIDFLSQHEMGANVEIKPYPGKEVETADAAHALLNKYWPEHLPPPLVSSFTRACLYHLRQQDSTLNLGLLMHTWEDGWAHHGVELDVVSIHVNHKILTQKRAAALKTSGCLLLSYTINEPKEAEQLFSWGIDGIFSDSPDTVLSKDPA